MRELSVPSDLSSGWAVELTALASSDGPSLDLVAALAAEHLPTEVLDHLASLRDQQSRHGALLIRGVALDQELPPTPICERSPPQRRSTPVSEGVMLGVGRLLGEPVGYAAEKDGVLVQDVFPVAGEHDAPSNASSSVDLGLHTELVFSRARPAEPLHEASPDFLLLLCLRPDPTRAAVTVVVEAQVLYDLLGAAVEVLRRPDFELRAPYSFTRDGEGARPWLGPVPLVHGPPDAPTIAFDLACGVRAGSPEAERALDLLRSVSSRREARHEVRLGRGDLLVIDNRTCAHGRTPFPAAFDGQDRWLQRSYVRRSLAGLEGRLAGGSRRIV